MDFTSLRERVVEEFRQSVTEFTSCDESGLLEEALQYSLLAGGKYLRPTIVAATSESYGAPSGSWKGFAAAIEAIHCGSLIHDDLPGLDNDDFRRGQPSCHVKFGEAVALLAGDAILPMANLQIIEHSQGLSGEVRLDLLRHLSSACYRLCRGQVADMEAVSSPEKLPAEAIINLHQNKTAALFQVAFAGGGIIAGLDEKTKELLGRIGLSYGLYFQLKDDIEDFEPANKLAGKTLEGEVSSNMVAVIGLDAANARLKELREEITSLAEGQKVDWFVKELLR